MASADLIVGLDYPRYISLGRLLRRSVSRLVWRTSVCNGNIESLRLLLARDSILWWHFRSFPRKRERMRRWQAELTKPQVLLFRSPAAVERWLNGLD